ncbi:ABC transporter permease [Mycobacterium sp. CVI_P3]|uniref:ABC transporter permease n=2 Tax=Mycobacterium pinniadriaticum TaxID=2994102 RepID=A0ABT3SLM4_9MYCO|nr:ABC transporter permease [Mycobacterium pinniadriaticum]MCX2933979.1 ABC transporter permease [Mycobacterium pinniadriaticum]MCX2940425.1 ABC transporter permease [Mycobacterium pinniadriaticum]
MVLAAGAVYWSTALGSVWTVPRAAVRAVLQLAAVAAVLTTALSRLWTSLLVLGVMFIAATITAARRSQSNRSWLLAVALAAGLISVVPLLLASGLVPMTGVAIVPIVGIRWTRSTDQEFGNQHHHGDPAAAYRTEQDGPPGSAANRCDSTDQHQPHGLTGRAAPIRNRHKDLGQPQVTVSGQPSGRRVIDDDHTVALQHVVE